MKPAFDTYTRRARVQPALIVALPLGLATTAWFSEALSGLGALWGLFVWCGGTALLAQLARDRGLTKEPRLFQKWGGKPTTRLLRHRDAPNNVTLTRYHKRLQELLKLEIPTPEQEQHHPAKADEIYDSCTAFLLEKTRDKDQFPVVFEELCNYGFRRNLWGMKPIGVTIATLGITPMAVIIFINIRKSLPISPQVYAVGVINLLLLLIWLFWLTPSWIKHTADAYAERLLAACDNLR